MRKITRDKLHSLEEYDTIRSEFRKRVMSHKGDRRLPIGPNRSEERRVGKECRL